MKHFIINLAGFQVGWFACILSAAEGVPLVGTLVVALVVGVHLWMCGARRAREAALLAGVGVVGALVDTLHVVFGTLRFDGGAEVTWEFLLWIGALWVNFAATLTVSFRWLMRRLWFAAILGAVSGPTTYFAGVKLGAIGFHETAPVWSWIALAVEWAAATPLLLSIASRSMITPAQSAQVQES